MQQLRHIDPDKITFGTYYQALLLCQRDTNDPQALQSNRKDNENYIPTQHLEQIEARRSQEEAKEWQDNQGPSLTEQNSINTAFRRGSMNEGDDDDVFYSQDAISDTNSNQPPQDRVIKLS